MSPACPLSRRPSALLSALLACAALLGAAAPARADAPIIQLLGAPIAANTPCYPGLDPSQFTPVAGTFTDYCAAYYVRGGAPEGDDPKRVVFDTPQGFLATSDISPQCSLEEYAVARGDAPRCAADTQVGDGQANVRVSIGGIPIAQSAPVKVYNLEHTDDELGKLGIMLAPELGGIALPRVKLIARITLRPAPDVGLRNIIDGLPQTVDLGLGPLPIATDSFFMRFWGKKADHPTLARDFAFLGTDCTSPQVTTATSTSWAGDVSSARSEFKLTGCDQLGFGVSGSVKTSEQRPDVTTETTVSVRPAISTTNRWNSNITETAVTLPTGMELAGQIAGGPDGLPLCTPEQFAWTSVAGSTCPPNSEVGKVAFTSPLIKKPFVGRVFLGSQPSEGALPEVYIEARTGTVADAPSVKIIGHMTFDDQGRIVTTLPQIAQFPFDDFNLTFRGGDNSILVTPRQCGTTTGVASSTPINGGRAASAPMSLTIDQDCIDPGAFTPSVAVGSSSSQAGATGTTTVSVSRPDRQARITHVDADLPPGVLADLNGVDTCAAADAAAARCPAGSRIGSVTAAAGVGPSPVISRGDVYLADRPDGAVAGVAIIVPVRFGDVYLGMLSLPARIDLRQTDLGLRFSADVPTRYRGFPLDLQRFDVALDRPGFGRNPTSCAPLTSAATLTSDLGGVASAPGQLQMTGCDRLGFAPSLQTALTGSTAPYGRPGVSVTLSLPDGNAAIKRAQVTLPLGLGADVKAAQHACPVAQFEAQACPPASIAGSASARLAITPEVLSGPVYLVQTPGTVLPGIGIQFQGRFAARIKGTITVSKTGLLVTEFPTVPDAPINSLDLNFAPGPGSVLIAGSALCKAPSIVFQARFESQSGQVVDTVSKSQCTGAAAQQSAALSGRLGSGLRLRLTAPNGKRLRFAVITLPAGVTVNRAALTRGGRVRGITGAYSLTRTGSRTLKLAFKRGSTGSVAVTVPLAALKQSAAAKRRATLTVAVVATMTDGSKQSLSVRLRR